MRNCVMIGATHALDSCISHLTALPPVIYTWSRRQSFSFSKSTSSRPPVIYFRSQSYSFMWLAPFSMRWMMKRAFQKESRKSDSDVNVSENLSDFGSAKKLLDSDNILIWIRTPTHRKLMARYSPECTVYLELWRRRDGVVYLLVEKRWIPSFYCYR